MAKNRLHLDFSLEYSDERKNFVEEYLKTEIFQQKPPSQEEIETIANYILWGKENDGKNLVQKKTIEIETKNTTWSKGKKTESLDELLENPAFDENTLNSVGAVKPLKTKRETFDRKKALLEAPPLLVKEFERLFRQIDEIDLLTNYYEILVGKRTSDPREQLLNRFSLEEQLLLQKKAKELNQYTYLKKRHLLVELRTQQYILQDSYRFQIQKESKSHLKYDGGATILGEDVPVFPLGLKSSAPLSRKIFVSEAELGDNQYSEEELEQILKFYWLQQNNQQTIEGIFFDFCNLEHVYQLLLSYADMKAEVEEKVCVESTLQDIVDTLEFYIKWADLKDIHKEILTLKINKEKNEYIANYINEKYQKNYTANYISTIFKQKIVKEINDAAHFHQEVVSNICFEENFKKCSTCGDLKLKSTHNFVRKTRAGDGLAGRCKKCDYLVREKKKQMEVKYGYKKL